MSRQHTASLAGHALGQRRSSPEPWTDRTSATHWHEGEEWAVVVDWAERTDGVRVPASVTLSSLGGVFGDEPLPGAQPQAVTRALVESVPWATLVWDSQESLRAFLPSVHRAAQYGSTNTEDRLRLVASLYRALGGEANPRIAEEVRRELELRGVSPTRRGPRAADGADTLSPTRVRAWIRQARQRGHLPPSERTKSTGTGTPAAGTDAGKPRASRKGQ